MNDTDIRTISFNMIYRKYESLMPDDKKDYYHIYEYLYNRVYDDQKLIHELISYVELGVDENIFPKWEIIQMVKISSSFFKNQILEHSEKLNNNNLIKEIMQIIDYIDTTALNSEVHIRGSIMNYEYKKLMEENKNLKDEVEYLKDQFKNLEDDIFNLKLKVGKW